MLDLPRLRRIRLSARPRVQRFLGHVFLGPNYGALPGVEIEFENLPQRLRDEPVLFAMNHTDRYNYWPFQYRLFRELDRYTATWVKGKYYEHPFVARFMELTNNIPTVSRGYLVTRDFIQTTGQPPSDAQYQALRGWVNDVAYGRADPAGVPSQVQQAVPEAVLRTPRDMLGRPFDPAREHYASCVDGLFRAMMARFVELNEQALSLGLHILVFPQGTRSVRLSRGHIGLAQIALHTRTPIVPVGCSGSDQVYPDSSPVARRGRVVYRFGEPIERDELEAFDVGPFTPFTPEAESAHTERFQALVDRVMERIDGLVDPPYRFSDGQDSEGVRGSSRFV